jgi:hypothetical protein
MGARPLDLGFLSVSVLRFTEKELAAYNAKRGGKAPRTTEAPAIRAVKDDSSHQNGSGRAFPASGTLPQSKYRNRPTGGYASAKEARRAAALKLLQDGKQIERLREQVPYVLIPSQKVGSKVAERPCSYVADFVYLENGFEVVEDCKGMRTADYIIKRKLMLWVHGIRIKET